MRKRDGTIVDFDFEKIRSAISKASMGEIEAGLIVKVSDCVENDLNFNDVVDVETIQDLVEKKLMEHGYLDIAKRYILYRQKHTERREATKHLIDSYNDIFFAPAKGMDLKRDNANINGDASMGVMLKMGAESAKYYALNYVIPEKWAVAHKERYIHIHDLDFSLITFNCLVLDLLDLFHGGFNTGHGFIREPKSIRSYASLECIAIQSSQNDFFGGQSIGAHDFAMAEGVRKSFKRAIIDKTMEMFILSQDTNEYLIAFLKNKLRNELSFKNIKYTETKYGNQEEYNKIREKAVKDLYSFLYAMADNKSKTFAETLLGITQKVYYLACLQVEEETHQAMEAVIHNFNTLHSRAGAQVPFSSLNYGMDTSPEGRLVIRETLNAIYAGMGNGETPIFPISIFLLKAGVNYNPQDPNYDLFQLSCKVSAKRLFPNYESLDAPYNLQHYREGDYKSFCYTMGCVDGEQLVVYKTFNKQTPSIDTFTNFYRKMSYFFQEVNAGLGTYLQTDYYVSIYDSFSGDFVNCKKIIRNPSSETDKPYRLKFSNGLLVTATHDHPFPVVGKGRTATENMEIQNEVLASNLINYKNKKKNTHLVSKNQVKSNDYFYDVETDSDHFDFFNFNQDGFLVGINSHNCRTRTIENVNGANQSVKRGNFAFVTINLPKLALEAKGNLDKFFELFDKYIQMSHDYLLFRLSIIEKKHAYNFPFMMGQHLYLGSEKLKPTDEIKEVLKQASLSIGFCGLAECLIALTGKHHGESKEAQELGLKIVGHLRDMTDKYKEEETRNWGTFATPAENCAGVMQKANREKYGVIAGVTDKEYMTNSFHVPVYYPIKAINKIKIEAPYHTLCNAGHISYVELDGDPSNNLKAFEVLVRAMHDANMGYFSINHPVDRDPICGYTGIIKNECPHCHRKEVENKHLRIRKATTCCDS